MDTFPSSDWFQIKAIKKVLLRSRKRKNGGTRCLMKLNFNEIMLHPSPENREVFTIYV